MPLPTLALGSLGLSGSNPHFVSPPPAVTGQTITDAASFATFMLNASPGDQGVFTDTVANSSFVYTTPRDMSGIILTAGPGAKIGQLKLAGLDHLTLQGITFENSNTTGLHPDLNEAENSMLSLTGCDNIIVSGCSFDGARTDQNYELFQNAVYLTSSIAAKVTACQFTHVYRAALITSCGNESLAGLATFTGNTIRNFVGQAVRVAWSDADISNNDIRGCIGRSGRRLNGVITGTLNVGDSISLNDAGTQGGQIMAVGAGYVNIKYNSHEKPVAAGQYKLRGAPGNFITVSSASNITTAFDPVHSDGIQAINNAGSRDYKLRINRNLIGRFDQSGLVNFPAISPDNGFPGIRIQQNNTNWYWDSDSQCDQNILTNDTTEPCQVDGFAGGTARGNLALYSSYANGAARIRIQGRCSAVNASGNISDYNGGLVDSGNNTITTESRKVSPSGYSTDFPGFGRDTPSNDLANFTPASNLGGAGPMTPAGQFRPLP